jgi:septal ring factor EnvC (AmiA/AmiB activator)
VGDWVRWALDALVIPIFLGVIALVRKVDKHDSELKALVDWMKQHELEDREMHQRFSNTDASIAALDKSVAVLANDHKRAAETLDEVREDVKKLLERKRG